MNFLELTLPTAAENVALDEALLIDCEQDEHRELLRLWEPTEPLVVLGRSSIVENEVDLAACRRDAVPVLRRVSGGTAIVGARGCLMYALVLSYRLRPELRLIDRAHSFVLDALAKALGRHVPGIVRAGTSDLARGERKFSGNSLRCQRTHVLYHGTLLYGMDPMLAELYLRRPPREPAYRRGRNHADFIAPLAIQRETLRDAILEAFSPTEPGSSWPAALAAQLVAEKYAIDDWNLSR